MTLSLSHVTFMNPTEMSDVKGVDHSALRGCIFELFSIVSFVHSLFNDSSQIHSTRPQALDERTRHCVFIDVQTDLHQVPADYCWNSFSRRSASSFSAARSASTSALLAW